jgi:hypothetical protein
MVNSKPNKLWVYQTRDEQLLRLQVSLQWFAPLERATGEEPPCPIHTRVHV